MKKLAIVLAVLAVIGGAAAAYLWHSYQTGQLQQVIVQKVGSKLVGDGEGLNYLQKALGFGAPRTYLVLFLNNTELRPGGGFIGAYAVLKIDKARFSLEKVEGSEILDSESPKDFPSVPPPQIQKYLKLERWYFRDSNWSPDFVSSSAKALELYIKEKGLDAENIDAVIGFTPTVMEEVLKISGPITVNGEEFTAENFTSKLEYEVEYNYLNKGLTLPDRKKMLYDLAGAFIKKLEFDLVKNWSSYYELAQRMLTEKQVALSAVDPEEQKILSAKNWSGEMKNADGDYLMWVDANLGALKTDASIKRQLGYRITPDTKYGFIAEASMKYIHYGKRDWRTTRYMTYARVFVPVGAELIDVKANDGQMTFPIELAAEDRGVENGRQWYGAYISVEPGQSKLLTFRYRLAPAATNMISQNLYDLTLQKQMGVVDTRLLMEFKFIKRIVSAKPGSYNANSGDVGYSFSTDFNADQNVEIELSQFWKTNGNE